MTPCSICGTAHRPELPHNPRTLTFQRHASDQLGRAPTWADAAGHCPPEILGAYRTSVAAFGFELGDTVDFLWTRGKR